MSIFSLCSCSVVSAIYRSFPRHAVVFDIHKHTYAHALTFLGIRDGHLHTHSHTHVTLAYRTLGQLAHALVLAPAHRASHMCSHGHSLTRSLVCRATNPSFEAGRQHDAHEFLQCLLGEICGVLDGCGPVSDPASCLFRGAMEWRTRCMECEESSRREENFLILTLTLKAGECRSLRALLCDYFSTRVLLRGGSKLRCSICRTHTEGERTVCLSSLPEVLVVHFNRTRQNGIQIAGEHVPVPSSLCLLEWCSDTCKERDALYSLWGVTFHRGQTSRCGHYMCYARCDAHPGAKIVDAWRGGWYKFDDARVEEVSWHASQHLCSPLSVDAPVAYLAFYRRN